MGTASACRQLSITEPDPSARGASPKPWPLSLAGGFEEHGKQGAIPRRGTGAGVGPQELVQMSNRDMVTT